MAGSTVKQFEMRGFRGTSWTRLGESWSQDDWLPTSEADDASQLFSIFSGMAEFGGATDVDDAPAKWPADGGLALGMGERVNAHEPEFV